MPKVTIWQNFEAHAAALTKLGATAAQLAPLRRAAEAVEKAEKTAEKTSIDPVAASAPLLIEPLGWTIQPPSKEARAWASRAVVAVTGGSEPSPGPGQVMAILAGLWALREAGDGNVGLVMRTVAGENALALVVAASAAELQARGRHDAKSLQQLAEGYAKAMGFQMPPTLMAAAAKYEKETLQILRTLAARLRTASSPKASSHATSSASTGTATGAPRPQPSLTRRSRSRSGSRRSATPQ